MYMTWFRLSSGSLNRWAVLPLYGRQYDPRHSGSGEPAERTDARVRLWWVDW